ncbi:MAG: dicarboxylate/amino acid:cation symporter [Oscillospiraceae bacterium]|nr:dicarboxylate/amino acid:cation symporter [Oscillospiraceae bacterium]
MKETKKKKKKLGITSQVFIALITGVIVGVIINAAVPASYVRDTVLVNGIFYVVGNGFIRLMKMLVVPLVFCSLICGTMAIGDTKKLGKVGIRTVGFYLATTACAIIVSLTLANLTNPGLGLDVSNLTFAEVEEAPPQDIRDTLLNIIPDNPIHSMASGDMLPIILFALFIGICIAKLGERSETVSNFFSQFNDIMMEMTMLVMKAAPVGVFCLVAKTFSSLGISAIMSLIKYIATVTLALIVQCVVVYMIILFIFTRLNPFKFLKKFFPVMEFAFSTATSNATIPLNIETLEKKMGVSKRISSFTIPLGATINMDGTSIMQGVAVIFAAQAFNIDLTTADYLTVILTATLASIGTAGVPSVGLITLSMVFASVGLPSAAIGLIMGVDRILDMMRTAVNITGDAVCTTVVAYQEKSINIDVFNE